jgi:hypothetical protein
MPGADQCQQVHKQGGARPLRDAVSVMKMANGGVSVSRIDALYCAVWVAAKSKPITVRVELRGEGARVPTPIEERITWSWCGGPPSPRTGCPPNTTATTIIQHNFICVHKLGLS